MQPSMVVRSRLIFLRGMSLGTRTGIQILLGCFRIAVIDSDPLMRDLAERWLSEAGHELVVLPTPPSEAVRRLDLIMLDVANPGRAAGRVEALRAFYDVPILVMSAHLRNSSKPSSALASRLQAAAVLPKPYTRNELLTAVAAAIGRRN
ncbi:hypothetical protein QTH87_26055 [Variovorax sp. J22P168]|uniref:hypothetical protein n=1 Tax=Variovorax jilinensis TaxID=3053513 RepID=UPI0025784901|nr:hypothetical protein [Variovorax sp. J22P168]MDM0015931.1 hypothetical protein [Variovorax sp. J22P168]